QLNSWVLSRYAECKSVLSDFDVFANDFRRIGIPTPPPILSLQTLDPPDQTPLRIFAKEALHAQNLKALEETTNQKAVDLLDHLASRETFDFVRDFADP